MAAKFFMFIYAARNCANGKLYVGLTALSVPVRWAGHINAAKSGSKLALHRAIRKHGPEAFVVEVVAQLLPGLGVDDLRLLERDIIAQEGCMVPAGYNLTAGGEGLYGYATGRVISDEERAHRSAKTKAVWADPSFREATSAARKASWSPERRAAVAERSRAMLAARETPLRGPTVQSPEANAARSAKMKGRQLPSEVQAKITAGKRASMADPVRGAETKAKIKAGWTPERKAIAAERRREMNKTLNTPERIVTLVARNQSPEQRAATRAFHAAKRTQSEAVH